MYIASVMLFFSRCKAAIYTTTDKLMDILIRWATATDCPF